MPKCLFFDIAINNERMGQDHCSKKPIVIKTRFQQISAFHSVKSIAWADKPWPEHDFNENRRPGRTFLQPAMKIFTNFYEVPCTRSLCKNYDFPIEPLAGERFPWKPSARTHFSATCNENHLSCLRISMHMLAMQKPCFFGLKIEIHAPAPTKIAVYN